MAHVLICPAGPLEAFTVDIVQRMGADAEVAAEVARHLVRANLSGHDSHGVLRIAQYVADADRGDLVPAARPAVAQEGAVAAVIDAGLGFGHFSTAFAMEWAMARARRHGVAMAAVRRSTHIGRLGEYTERTAAVGLIGIVTVGAAGPGVGGVVPHGGRARFLGTNPWSISVPGHSRSLVFDAATSTVAEGKVRVYRAKRAELPPGCVMDAAGRPSRDPEALYAGGALQPVGGEVAGHKGYGLALASALLGGLGMADPRDANLGGVAAPLHEGATGRIAGVFVQVIDPAAFGDADRYRTRVDDVLAAAKRVAPAPGHGEVLVAGEPEARAREERGRQGIAIPEATWAELARAAGRFGVALPEHRAGDA
jgi:LDH2 family malate/lactate/ureidoglycolate dehydrogenase